MDQLTVPTADGDLLQRFAESGDEPAFAALVDRHHRLVHGVCRRITGDDHDAEDATQAVFLVLALKARRLSGVTCHAAWLHRVARHVALRARESAQARRRRHGALTIDPPAPEAPADRIDEVLALVPERYRAPLLLHYVDGLDCAGIGRRLGISPEAAAMRLSRGRERLRRRLGQAVSALVAGGLSGSAASGEASAIAGDAARLVSGIGVDASSGVLLAKQALLALALAKGAVAATWVAAALVLAGGAIGGWRLVAADAPTGEALPTAAQMVSQFSEDGMVERIIPRWRANLERALETPITIAVDGIPARDFVERISRACGVAVTIDTSPGDEPPPVSMHVKGMSAVNVLHFWGTMIHATPLLRESGVVMKPNDGLVEATTLRFHLACVGANDRTAASLVDLVAAEAEAEAALAQPGEPADDWSHHLAGTLLDVTGTSVDRPVLKVLSDLRHRGARTRAGKAELDWRRTIALVQTWDFEHEPFEDALNRLRQQTHLTLLTMPEIYLTGGGQPLTFHADDTSVAVALPALVSEAGLHLSWFAKERSETLRGGEVEVTEQSIGAVIMHQPAEPELRRRVYDLRALRLEGATAALRDAVERAHPTSAPRDWDGLLLVHLDLPALAAIETLLGEVAALPEANRHARIVAYAKAVVNARPDGSSGF